MPENKPLYLTTTLPYVNADPHIGFALEIVHADSFARFNRLMGREVFFNFGTDEHGQKVWQKAQEAGREVQEYVDEYALRFKDLKNVLNLSYDAFIRTTDDVHVRAAQEMWRRALAAGDIYKKTYKGLYCIGCEAFVKESDLVNGKCPNHPTQAPEVVEEENYFFRFSKYEDKLLEYLKGDVVLPDWRKTEAVNFVKSGLEDFSISREKGRMPWGIPVPGDESQVMYVWFDALTNYISTLGWPVDAKGNFKKFWQEGEVVQFAGKDQVRFQSLIWQAMLLSVGVKSTDRVVYHGFITSGGQKMSKSIGNVIDPVEIVSKHGTDALRYYLLRHIHPFDDSDFTEEKFIDAYNGNLANGLGNLVSRIMKMAESNLGSPIEHPKVEKFPEEYTEAIEEFRFNDAMDYVWSRFQALDERITKEEPFKLIKNDEEKGKKLIEELVKELYLSVRLLNPFLPETNQVLKEAILANKKPETLFPRLDS